MKPLHLAAVATALLVGGAVCNAANWPRWRGPAGNAVSSNASPPVEWSRQHNVCWKVRVPGEGCSSPVVWDRRVFVTSALDGGLKRVVHCMDLETGRTLWTGTIDDENPEITSALTGHAASTPATDGRRLVAFFGNAGVVCFDLDGRQLWHRDFGEFETELGLASSPIIYRKRAILLCDHDGDRFGTFDSFLIALDLGTGETCWKTERPGLFRSWSTPILVSAGNESHELIVNAQDELRAYNPDTGAPLWSVRGMTGWVTPSPVFGKGLIFAASGRDGPTMAVRPGGRGDATGSHVVWKHDRGGPYVCSPLAAGRFLYVHDEQGVLACFEAATGALHYRRRLGGKFFGSGAVANGKLYLTNEAGTTFVVKLGEAYELLAKNSLGDECLASPAICSDRILLRTRQRLYCIGVD